MQGDINLNLDIERVAALVDVLYVASERAAFVSGMRDDVESLRANAKEYVDALDRFYDQVNRVEVNVDEIDRAADSARQSSEAARERLHPQIEKFGQRKDAPFLQDDDEARHLVMEIISIAESMVAQTTDLHKKLLHLAIERRAASDDILRARPLTGDVDHGALSREFMARFPKIRAALAK